MVLRLLHFDCFGTLTAVAAAVLVDGGSQVRCACWGSLVTGQVQCRDTGLTLARTVVRIAWLCCLAVWCIAQMRLRTVATALRSVWFQVDRAPHTAGLSVLFCEMNGEMR